MLATQTVGCVHTFLDYSIKMTATSPRFPCDSTALMFTRY